MLSAREPEWEPLLNFAPDHVIDFMWMYTAELTDGTRLQAYKHYWTRDYLHLDDGGRAFIYVGEGRYEEVSPPWLLHSVLRQELDQDGGRYSVRQNVWPGEPAIRFARSATRHRISRERSLSVIERCGFQVIDQIPGKGPDRHVLILGDDLEGVALEILTAETEQDEFTVIHAMNLRNKYLGLYEEAKKWRK